MKKRDITVLSLATVSDEEIRQISATTQIDTGQQSIGGMNVRKEKTSEAKKARKLMKMLAEDTGGYAFFPENDSKLNDAIGKLRSVIRSEYVLSYKPPQRTPGLAKS